MGATMQAPFLDSMESRDALDRREQVAGALDTLVRHPQGIGMALVRAGIHGEKANSAECPISHYITTVCGGEIVVGDRSLTYDDKTGSWGEMDLPAPITRFIQDFDQGAYPILEMTPGVASILRRPGSLWRDREGAPWVVTRAFRGCVRIDSIDPVGQFVVMSGDQLAWSMTFAGMSA